MRERTDTFWTFGCGVNVGGHGPIGGRPFRAEYEEIHTRRSTKEVARCWGSLARDASGRVRRDSFTPDPNDRFVARHLTAIWDRQGETYYFIDEPAGELHTLEPRRMIREAFAGPLHPGCRVSDAPGATPSPPGGVKRELLGERTIDHVACVGIRYTDESGCQITDEWFSKDLGITFQLVSKGGDIEVVYRVFNVEFSEPDATLFAAPQD